MMMMMMIMITMLTGDCNDNNNDHNRPFAGSGHMVRNKLHWDANNAVGLPKQRNSYQSSPTFLCFESPTALFASQCNLFLTMWPDPAKGLLKANWDNIDDKDDEEKMNFSSRIIDRWRYYQFSITSMRESCLINCWYISKIYCLTSFLHIARMIAVRAHGCVSQKIGGLAWIIRNWLLWYL